MGVRLSWEPYVLRELLEVLQPEERDLASSGRGLGHVVAVPGVDLLSKRLKACVFDGIGHLAGAEVLAAETAFGPPGRYISSGILLVCLRTVRSWFVKRGGGLG